LKFVYLDPSKRKVPGKILTPAVLKDLEQKGKANLGELTNTYYEKGGRHCYDKNWKEKGYTECLQILFFIDNDKVKISDVIYP
jgi:hypothetical protein